jgi:hypothetical protein
MIVLTFLSVLTSPAGAEVYNNAFLRAEVTAVKLLDDKRTVTFSLVVDNTTALPYPVIFLSAALIDDRGNFLDPAGQPTGIPTGRPYSCAQGNVLTPGAHLVIVFSFKLPSRAMSSDPRLALSAEFQAQRGTCENFTVSLRNLEIAKE